MFIFTRRLGYNKEIREMHRIKKKIDKAYECPDCKVMIGDVEKVGNKYISTCSRCGLMWETR